MGQLLGRPSSKKKAKKARKCAQKIKHSAPNASREPEDTYTRVDPRTPEASTINSPTSNDRFSPTVQPPFPDKFQGELASKLRARRSSGLTVEDCDQISDLPTVVNKDDQTSVSPDLVGMQHKLAVGRHLNRRPPTRGNTPKAALANESAEAAGDSSENACTAFFSNPSVTSTPLTVTKLNIAIAKHDQSETLADTESSAPTTTLSPIGESPVKSLQHDLKVDENPLNPSPHEIIESKSVVAMSPVRKHHKISVVELATNTQSPRPRTFSLSSDKDASITESTPRSQRHSTSSSVMRVVSYCDETSADQRSPSRLSHPRLAQQTARLSDPLKGTGDDVQLKLGKGSPVTPRNPLTTTEEVEPVNGNCAEESVSTRAQVSGAKLHSPKPSEKSPDASSKSDDRSSKLTSNASDPNKRLSKIFESTKSFENSMS